MLFWLSRDGLFILFSSCNRSTNTFCICRLKHLLSENLCRWKLLDFAELKRSSISFFDIDQPESAVSRWSRATTKAAKACTFHFLWMNISNNTQPIIFVVLTISALYFPCCQVGKGLSKDERAQKLALQHWLEAVSLRLSFPHKFLPKLCY